MKVILILAILVALVSGLKKETSETENRGVQVYWSECDGCICKYFNVYAYEYETKTNGAMDEFHYLYIYHEDFDTCNWTWVGAYVQQNTEVAGLWISKTAKNARLNVTGLVDSGGHTISVNLKWDDVGIKSSCNCRYADFISPYTYKQTSSSKYSQTSVEGTFSINGVDYHPSGVIGYINDYGSKTVYLTHP